MHLLVGQYKFVLKVFKSSNNSDIMYIVGNMKMSYARDMREIMLNDFYLFSTGHSLNDYEGTLHNQ